MKLIRRAVYIGTSLVLLVVLFVALVLFAPAAAQPVVKPVRAWLLRTVSTQVSKSLNGSMSIGSLEGSLLSAPTIQDVVLKDARGDTVVQLQTLRLHYDLTQLLQRKLLIHEIAIVQPQAKVVQAADGSVNLSRLVPPADTPPPPADASSGFVLPLDIELTSLTIQNGHAELALTALPGVHTVKDLSLQMRGAFSKARYDIELQQLAAKTLPAEVNLNALRVALEQTGSAIQIKDFQLDTDTSHIAINGALPGGTQPANLTVKIEPFDMADVGRLLADPTLTGLLQAQITAEGPPEALNLSGHIRAEGGEIALNGRLDMAATSPAYQAALDITKLNIAALIHRDALESDLNLHLAVQGSGLALQEVQGDARVQIKPSTFGDIVLNPSDIHVLAQGQRIDVQQFHLDTSVAQMRVDGLLDLAGDSALDYDLQVKLADLRQLLGTETLDGTAHLQGKASGTWPDLTTNGTLSAQELHYDANQLRDVMVTYEAVQLGAEPRATAHIQLQEAQLGTLPVAQLDLQATYDQATSQLQVTTEVTQSADCGGTLAGSLSLIDHGTGTDKIILLDTLHIRLQDRLWSAPQPLDVVLAANGININRVHLTHDDESITASGRLDGDNFDNLRVNASNIDLDFLRTLLALPELVSGQASLDATLSGTMENPQFKTDLQIHAPNRPSLPFEDLRVTLDYTHPELDGQIHVSQQERDIIGLNLHLPVKIALNDLSPGKLLVDAPVALNLNINRPDLKALQRALPSLPSLAGTVQGHIDLHGTYAQLELDSTIELRQFGLVGTVENVNAPLQLSGTVATVQSVAALIQALADGNLSPSVRDLTLRASSIAGQLPSPGQAAQPWRVNNLELRADAQLPNDVTLHALSLQAQAFDLPATQLNLAAAIKADRLDVKRLTIQSAGSELNGVGHMSLQNQSVQFNLDMPRLRLSDFVPTLPENLPVDVHGTIDVAGSTRAPKVLLRLGYAGARIEANVAAELQKALPRYQGKLTIQGLEVAPFMPDTSGRINARIRLNGEGFDGKNRRANVALDLDSQSFALAPGLTAELRAKLQGNALQLNTLYLKSDPVTLDAGGSLSGDRQAAFTYSLTLGDLTPIRQQLGLDLDVQGQFRGKLSGALDALSAEGELQLAPWRYATWRGKSIDATFNAQHLTTHPQAKLQANIADAEGPSLPLSTVEIAGTYNPDRGGFDVRVTEGPFQNTQITGEATLEAGQDLTLTTLNLQRGDWNWSNPKPIRVHRDASGRLEVSDFELRNGQQTILVQATLPPQGPIAGNVRINQLHIPPNAKAFAPDVAVPDGYVQLNMQLKGTMQDLGAEGVLQLTDLAWQKRQLGELEAQLNWAKNTLTSDVHWRDQQTDLLRLQGDVGLDAAGALNMTIQSQNFDLSRLPSYTDAVAQSAGDLNLDLRLSGTTRQPEINGQLDLANGLLQLPATGEPYKNIRTQINFAGDRITLETLNVGSQTGTLNLKGWLQLAGTALKELDFTMAADNFTAIKTRGIEAILNSNLNAKGSLEALMVKGRVEIPWAKVRIKGLGPIGLLTEGIGIEGLDGGGSATVSDEQLDYRVVYGTGKKPVESEDGTPSATSKANPVSFLQADVDINMPRNIWVQGKGTAIELSGDLRVTKALQSFPIIAGDIHTLRGFASYLGRKFTLAQGRITFTGSQEINPALDITANHKVSGNIVTINVQGNSKLPKITFSSKPEALEQADIISLLTFGRTMDKLSGSEQNSLANKAQNAAVGAAAGAAASALGQQVGLDSVEVEIGDDPSQSRVGTGKYITQDIFLSYERQLGEEGGNSVGVELSLDRVPVPLLKNFKLKGSSSSTGETAVDLLWRKDY